MTQAASREQKDYRNRVQSLRNRKPVITPEVKENLANHKRRYVKSREPLLKDITTQYDLDLFREAQAKACEQIVGFSTPSFPFFIKYFFRLLH